MVEIAKQKLVYCTIRSGPSDSDIYVDSVEYDYSLNVVKRGEEFDPKYDAWFVTIVPTEEECEGSYFAYSAPGPIQRQQVVKIQITG